MVYHPLIGERIADVIIILILIACMFAAVIPMWHTLMSSFSDGQLLVAQDGLIWKWVTQNGKLNWNGYLKTLNYDDFAIIKSYAVTLLYVIGGLLCGITLNIIAAYVLFRRPKAGGIFTMFLIFTMMFSGGTIPTYMVIRTLGMTGTPWSLIIPGCTNAMFVVTTLNGFRMAAASTVEAAELDGAGHFTIMFRVLLPQSMGMVMVTMINQAMLTWNAWYNASIYVPTDRQWWPLQLWIKQIVADNSSILTSVSPDFDKYLVSYCVILIATIPVLLVMPKAQRELQKGSLLGAVKE